ncbi:hypothetical protein EXIGLDRAFT_40916 [Exidia glandulosa HHB12029]|uniref:Uncharacterized protein n=1 Tax=Exidia glandulosa HHB12029 TaxID=1314781 RepID=A0A165IM93_EXIGL|nr:hypothetical protein EXIGLDRAFT_40916 [Exidia glandulosa HHB12029]
MSSDSSPLRVRRSLCSMPSRTRLPALSLLATHALPQSLTKQFSPQTIDVLTSTLDCHISTDRSKARLGDECDEWSTNEDRPESIACEEFQYLYISNQDSSAWTCEINLSAVHERW